MILTNSLLQSLSGKEIVYRAKSMLYKVELRFSYQVDEDRFIAASHLEVRSFGRLIHEEARSSRYFSRPQVTWSDFTYNGKLHRPPANALDLCLLPFIFQLQLDSSAVVFIIDWKLWNVEKSVDSIYVDGGKTKLEFKQNEDNFLQTILIHTKFAKNIRLERQ